MKEISSGVCPEGTVDNLWNYFISQATGFRMGPPHGPLTREIHESILWVGHSLNLLHPQFDPSQGFFGPKSASGDFLTVIIYFDFRNDKVGKESTVTLFWNTFCLLPSLTHAHTQQGAIPNLRYSQPFTRSFIKQSWWKRKWGDTLPSSSFRCICQVLAAGTQGLKALRHFLSHFITVSLYLTSWTRHIAAIIKQKKKTILTIRNGFISSLQKTMQRQ